MPCAAQRWAAAAAAAAAAAVLALPMRPAACATLGAPRTFGCSRACPRKRRCRSGGTAGPRASRSPTATTSATRRWTWASRDPPLRRAARRPPAVAAPAPSRRSSPSSLRSAPMAAPTRPGSPQRPIRETIPSPPRGASSLGRLPPCQLPPCRLPPCRLPPCRLPPCRCRGRARPRSALARPPAACRRPAARPAPGPLLPPPPSRSQRFRPSSKSARSLATAMPARRLRGPARSSAPPTPLVAPCPPLAATSPPTRPSPWPRVSRQRSSPPPRCRPPMRRPPPVELPTDALHFVGAQARRKLTARRRQASRHGKPSQAARSGGCCVGRSKPKQGKVVTRHEAEERL